MARVLNLDSCDPRFRELEAEIRRMPEPADFKSLPPAKPIKLVREPDPDRMLVVRCPDGHSYRASLSSRERRALYLQKRGRIMQYLKEFPNGAATNG